MQGTVKKDVIVIGAGPAGLCCAAWCRELGLSVLVLEAAAESGGQLLWINGPIANYPGIKAANGREFRELFMPENIEELIRCEIRVTSIDTVSRTVATTDGTFAAEAVVIATGVSRRTLKIPGEKEFFGRGVLHSGAGSKGEMGGKDVVIVGGGDAAFENAMILSGAARSVAVVHRRDRFTARKEFLDAVLSRPNVKLIRNAALAEIAGDDAVRSVSIRDVLTGEMTTLPADAVLIRIGVAPNTEFVPAEVSRDSDGYLLVDHLCRTKVEAVFAVGDITGRVAPTIVSAAGNGATAAKAVRMLVRS
ncbi:MAG: FAD-dependent oxidoreductase [Chloracidobacterium sp.]|nr:FAD-dependent oxidoreductase [Chloracidobacterium sp.]MCO5333520.1 NAD(P)/FAD-dependent oxidoreductase [Pyrinomonadaceae bacterium]